MRALPPLNPLLAFEVAARLRSFTRAARELNVTQGAVSHQIAVLEDYFGARLFERRSSGVELTPAAVVYADALHAAFDDLRRATAAFSAASSRETLTIKGYPLLLSRWLTPRLPAYSRRSPQVDVRLVSISGASTVDFEQGGVDVGVRYGRGRWRGLTSHLLFADELTPVCTPGLAEELALASAADLSGQALLQTHARSTDWPDWFRLAGVEEPDLRKVRGFEDLGLVLRMAMDGAGVAILQRAYVEEELRTGRLVTPCGPVLRRDLGYYLIHPVGSGRTPKVRDFCEWMVGEVEAEASAPPD